MYQRLAALQTPVLRPGGQNMTILLSLTFAFRSDDSAGDLGGQPAIIDGALPAKIERRKNRIRSRDPDDVDSYLPYTGLYTGYQVELTKQLWKAAGLSLTGRAKTPEVAYLPPFIAFLFLRHLELAYGVETTVNDGDHSSIIHSISLVQPHQLRDICSFEQFSRCAGRANLRISRSGGDIRFIANINVEYHQGKAIDSVSKLIFVCNAWTINGSNADLDKGTDTAASDEQWIALEVNAKAVIRAWLDGERVGGNAAGGSEWVSSAIRIWARTATNAPVTQAGAQMQ